MNIELDEASSGPMVISWPSSLGPASLLTFETASEWQAFVAKLALNAAAPDIVQLKYRRAQKLYMLGWLDIDLIKAGELVALTALELALTDKFGTHKRFALKLKDLVEKHGLTDAQVPMVVKFGGTVVGTIVGTTEPTLAQIRNKLAHGDPFDGFPVGGLLELVRDLIEFIYRDRV
jgi:hypothetical protein